MVKSDFVGPSDMDVPPFGFNISGTIAMPARSRNPDKIKYIVNHRVGGPGYPDTADELITALLDDWENYVGERCCPYWALLEPSGRVVITHPMTRAGRHAGKYDAQGRPAGSYNPTGIAIGWVGNFSKHAPTAMQWDSGIRLNAWALKRLGLGIPAVYGHDELPGATPGKVCPGPLLNMDALRETLANLGA